MTTPTLLIAFASLVLGGVSLINNSPLSQDSWKSGAIQFSGSAAVSGLASATNRKPGSGIFLAHQSQSLPQGVTRYR